MAPLHRMLRAPATGYSAASVGIAEEGDIRWIGDVVRRLTHDCVRNRSETVTGTEQFSPPSKHNAVHDGRDSDDLPRSADYLV